MQGKSILEALLFQPALKRDVSHGCAPFQSMDTRRIVVGEEDLKTNRIASVFKVIAAKHVDFAFFFPL